MAIISKAPTNEATMGNVTRMGGFKIKNSTKAFTILSTSIYSFPIRAIIRELSCNAIDAHVAAGNLATPYELHLPTALEPWFSIRDYGIGMRAEDVENVFTVYFESTKTDSNDYIGALGLGAKTPFSETDNFTVVTIRDGIKNVYTAFKNENGEPDLVQMLSEASDEPAGVEIRFAVEDRHKFNSYQDEARRVYKYFTHRPKVTGGSNFEFSDPDYKDKDIIPGVHLVGNNGYYDSKSSAIMGNIEYPIDTNILSKDLGDLTKLLQCGLVMNFDIGELDFQASREQLHYIPQTIEAIRAKLEQLNSSLAGIIATEADALDNEWNRSQFLITKSQSQLWSEAVKKYVTDTKFELMPVHSYYHRNYFFQIKEDMLASKFNIKVSAFSTNLYGEFSNIRTDSEYDHLTNKNFKVWNFPCSSATKFAVNDTNIGALARTKYHWKESELKRDVTNGLGYHNTGRREGENVYVIERVDKTKEMKLDAFFAFLHQPPTDQRYLVSEFMKQERQVSQAANVTIMKLVKRGGYKDAESFVWREVSQKLDKLSTTEKYYYVPLSGYASEGVAKNVYDFRQYLADADLFTGTIYGVRKGDIKEVEQLPNWINIDTLIKPLLQKQIKKFSMLSMKGKLDFTQLVVDKVDQSKLNAGSPYKVFCDKFSGMLTWTAQKCRAFSKLADMYELTVEQSEDDATSEYNNVRARYPLLSTMTRGYSVCTAENVTNYVLGIDLIESQKEVTKNVTEAVEA